MNRSELPSMAPLPIRVLKNGIPAAAAAPKVSGANLAGLRRRRSSPAGVALSQPPARRPAVTACFGCGPDAGRVTADDTDLVGVWRDILSSGIRGYRAGTFRQRVSKGIAHQSRDVLASNLFARRRLVHRRISDTASIDL